MREYGQIPIKFWDETRGWTDSQRTLACYLMTGPHSNALGTMRLPLGYLLDDLGWDKLKALGTLEALDDQGFFLHDRPSGWGMVAPYLRLCPPKNPSTWLGIKRLVLQVPEPFRHYQALCGVVLHSLGQSNFAPDGFADLVTSLKAGCRHSVDTVPTECEDTNTETETDTDTETIKDPQLGAGWKAGEYQKKILLMFQAESGQTIDKTNEGKARQAIKTLFDGGYSVADVLRAMHHARGQVEDWDLGTVVKYASRVKARTEGRAVSPAREWEKCLAKVTRSDYKTKGLNPKTLKALKAIGGLEFIGQTHEAKLDRLRVKFMTAWR